MLKLYIKVTPTLKDVKNHMSNGKVTRYYEGICKYTSMIKVKFYIAHNNDAGYREYDHHLISHGEGYSVCI